MEDTIAAISTSTVSSGGISVVRISGENALSVAQQVFRSKKNKNVEDMESHTVHYGNIYNGEELIDEVLMVVMKAPNTYTREDVVEIDCHGGILVTRKVLEAAIKAGAKPAGSAPCRAGGIYKKSLFKRKNRLIAGRSGD
mgnify:CR=1 FL=1